jgi:integrase
VPRDVRAGLAPKTVRNIQNMLHLAFGAAQLWQYIDQNPTEHVTKPKVRRRRPETWTAEQLWTFLREADSDRFRALWRLVATTGMRPSELAGAERKLLNLDAATLAVERTRVVVDGKPIDEDGKTDAGRRTVSLDAATVAIFREHLTMLDAERKEWGPSYPNHGKLFCYEDGRRIHPDTITRRFNRIVDRTGLPRITLHGVRHSYATVSIDGGVNPKVVSERIGHSSVAFTMQIYVQRTADLMRDAAAAAAIADLIQGGAAKRGDPAEPDPTEATAEKQDGDAAAA